MQADALQEIKSLLGALATRFSALENEVSALRGTITASRSTNRERDDSVIMAQGSEPKARRHKRHKRHRGEDEDLPVLERDDLLLKMLECVGTADWLYIASISRRWRGLYFSYCTKQQTQSSTGEQDLMRTNWAAVTMTAERLKLAFTCGLNVDTVNDNLYHFCEAVGGLSVAPIPVMTLARVRGVDWHTKLCSEAAWKGDWAFLKWLRESGCPWCLEIVYYHAMCNSTEQGAMSILPWIQSQTDTPLEIDEVQELMFDVGGNCDSDFVVWLRTELQAPWPDAFVGDSGEARMCWSVSAVHYALKHGSGWGAWRCQDLKPELYTSEIRKYKAAALFKWAHAEAATHGFTCPCTCEEAQT